MQKSELIKYVRHLRKLEEIRLSTPLALARLWTPKCELWDGLGEASPRAGYCGQDMIYLNNDMFYCPDCDITEKRTSQRRAIQTISTEAHATFGGNRSGKTESAMQFAVATALGSNEWQVQQWIKNNQIPNGLIQSEPSTVWVSGLSYGDALTYLRPKIESYCPAGTIFRRWNAQNRAWAIFPNGGRIQSLSADAGREKFQGANVQLVILDEEHPKEIFDECMLRTADSRGRVITSMTPLKGLTWAYDVFLANPQKGYSNYSIYGLDNPFVDSDKLRKAVSHMSEASQRARLFGEFVNQEGLVYSEFNRRVHVIESKDLPAHWERYRAIDFGVRNPFACLYFALDPSDDILHVYREYYATEKTSLENGQQLNYIQKRYNEEYLFTVADPESRDGRLTLARECNIETKPAPKHFGVVETINWVKERLAQDSEGRPHLIVHDNCKNLIKEFRLYRWSSGQGKDRPIKQHDHALDALRYMISFLKRYELHQ